MENSWAQELIVKGRCLSVNERESVNMQDFAHGSNKVVRPQTRVDVLMPRPVERFLAAERVEVHGPRALDDAWGN